MSGPQFFETARSQPPSVQVPCLTGAYLPALPLESLSGERPSFPLPAQIVGDALSSKALSVAEQAKFGWNDAVRYLLWPPPSPSSCPRGRAGATLMRPTSLPVNGPRPQDSAATFLLNIPARFDFESALFEARLSGRSLTPSDLSTMMSKSWENRYGDALEEMDSMFWASKLHFHLTGAEFYNFPYSFGFLFALGVCARREELGAHARTHVHTAQRDNSLAARALTPALFLFSPRQGPASTSRTSSF